jgi:ABC-type uncharacterized transport system permease subunit
MIRKRQQDIAGRNSVFQITILFLYMMAGTAFALNRLPRLTQSAGMLLWLAFLLAVTGLLWHFFVLAASILGTGGLSLTLGNVASFIGLQLALIAILDRKSTRLNSSH